MPDCLTIFSRGKSNLHCTVTCENNLSLFLYHKAKGRLEVSKNYGLKIGSNNVK